MLGPKQTTWKIIYSHVDGPARGAVELLSREIGRRVTRKAGFFDLHVLPCERETPGTRLDENAIIVGMPEESPLVARFIPRGEIPAGGYAVNVFPNPKNPEARVVVIAAASPAMLLAGAVAFIDDYPALAAPVHGGLRYPDRLFDFDLPPRALAAAPRVATRGIFAWGHPVNDYRGYLRDMARLKLNRLILWNDYVPINARDIVRDAHGLGIDVLFGFAWGWVDGCGRLTDISPAALAAIRGQVIRRYEEDYRDIGCDGIYFQSFTERNDETIGGRLIAAVVADFVNDVAGELLRRHPGLLIQFGLHASSVRRHLEAIARVDPRVDILWEDCGAFPYAYIPACDERAFADTLRFTERILALRPGAPTGLVFKGFATLDWCGHFHHQKGPFILGENDPEILTHDRRLRDDAWRVFSAEWVRHGGRALQVARLAREIAGAGVGLYMAGLFDGGRWLPEAICAEIFWNPDDDWATLLERVMLRPGLQMG